METTVNRHVEADPDTVWAVLTDIEGSQHVLSAVERTERLDDGQGFGVGLRWRETRTMFGREATEVMAVTAVDAAARRYVVEADGAGAHYRSVLQVVADPTGGSTLTMTFGGEPQGGLQRVLAATVGRLLAGATRRALRQDLDDIAAAAEAR